MGKFINNDQTVEPSAQLTEFLSSKTALIILTGAGISVSSGIPTYRDTNGIWQRSEPIQHQAFLAEPRSRQRYWLRSYNGWPLIKDAQPTISHHAIARLEQAGTSFLTVTQNVDGLHQKAGSRKIIDLHGKINEVICMDCQNLTSRAELQTRLAYLGDKAPGITKMAPDGDADIEDRYIEDVVIPECLNCGGMLKPNVVFFGDNVDRNIVNAIYSALDDADGLLIVGTSLKVFSGYRFCRYAAEKRIPIGSVNPGISRGDDLISTRIKAPADDVFRRWTDQY